jgi:hypothetical protein
MFKMFFNVKQSAKKVLKKKEPIVTEEIKEKGINPASKTVYAFVDGECVGEYDSITKCASILGLSRPMVKKAIESGVVLTNGFILKSSNK